MSFFIDYCKKGWPPKCWRWAWNNMPHPDRVKVGTIDEIKWHNQHRKECPYCKNSKGQYINPTLVREDL